VHLTSTTAITSATVAYLYDPLNCENAMVALDNEKRLLTTSPAADTAYRFPQTTVDETYKMITRYHAASMRMRRDVIVQINRCQELSKEFQPS
jgi:hypothetical protein